MVIAYIKSAGLHFVVDVDGDNRARLIHFSALPFDEAAYQPENYSWYYNLIELRGEGYDANDHHASRHTVCMPGWGLKYVSHRHATVEGGQVLEVVMSDGAVQATMHYRFYDTAAVVRSYATVENLSDKPFTIDYVSSFSYFGLAQNHPSWDDDTFVYIPHNSSHSELQWRKSSVWQLGLSRFNSNSNLKKLQWHQTGTWSSSEFIPMGVFENPLENTAICWQVEHNGSWYTEMGNAKVGDGLYLQLTGPNGEYSHFRKTLQKGDTFDTVTAACGAATGGFTQVIGEMTKYRRLIRRPNADNEQLPVIFNDYMNCLFGNPYTHLELPLIDAAAEAGAEYFVMDAGWFAEPVDNEGEWWSSIGVWKESAKRFPSGLNEVFDYVRAKGMKPGIWIEIEGIGPDSELAKTLPDDWFFQINGKRVIEHYRFQLDFRHPDVRAFADKTLDEVIEKYGLKYLKIDYNINASWGTDYNAESVGDGLLGHTRAYLAWLDKFFERHPDVVIENCASGGQRMDWAMLSRLSIQSTSDQTNYEYYPSISAMASTALTPEQAAVWSYPNFRADEEEAIFNMVSAMLGRIHQAGHLNKLPPANFARVKEGIACYKSIRDEIKTGLPVYPLGLIRLTAPWAAAGIVNDRTLYLSVWRKDGENATQDIPLDLPADAQPTVTQLYPSGIDTKYELDGDLFRITLPEKRRARFFKITF